MEKTDPYTGIAEAYDYILRHVDYDQWFKYIISIMVKFISNPKSILELGCGTGKFGAKFSAANYQIFGIDKSISMLRVAKTRTFRNFRIICADMTDFSLSGDFDFIFSVHDTMNYQLTTDGIRKVLRCVKNVMHTKSIFLFDITTEHNINSYFNNKTSFYKTRGMNIEWSNRYIREKKYIISNFTTRFDDGRVFMEEHIQRIYARTEIEPILAEEGFEILEIYSDYTYNPPSDDTIMINFITKKRDDS